MSKFKIVLGLFVILFLVASCQAISVSMSSNGASVSESFVMPSSSQLDSSATLSDGKIYHETSITGDAVVSQSTSGGGQTFQANVVAPDLKTTQIATSEGVSGGVSSGNLPLMTATNVETLAANPEIEMSVSYLSVGGKPIIIRGGAYPTTGVDLTERWYVDPTQTFKYTTFATSSVANPNPWYPSQNWQMVRNAITTSESDWNAAAGKPIFDGIITTDKYRSGYDGINAIGPSGGFALGTNLMRTITYSNTATRRVLDSDIAINLDYTPNLWQSQGNLDTVLRHELGHTLGVKHNDFSSASVMNSLYNGIPRGLSGDDMGIVWAKYNN